MSQFFKKVGNSFQSAFAKAAPVANSIFQKSKDVVKNITNGNISRGLSNISGALGSAARVGNQIIDSPFATALAASMGPEGLVMQQGASRLLGGLAKGSNIAGKASNLTDVNSYTKGGLSQSLENLEDARRRVGNIRDAAKVPSLTFV
jgi:hypothetical protein